MRSFVLATALAALAWPAAAQTAPNATQQFVNKAAVTDIFEMQAGRLALDRATNSQVKQFGQMIVDDHTKISNELKAHAQKIQGIQIPSSLDADHRKKLDELRAANGAAFDQRFKAQQIEGHQAAVALYDDYAKSGENAELKSWAQNTLPMLRKHLQQAQALPSSQAPVVGAGPAQSRTAQNERPQGRQEQLRPLAAPGPDHILASDLRGTRVYGANNENIGDINDILIERNGRVAAVVVGVGGFLGIGEKNVAVPFESLEVTGDQRRSTTGQGKGTTDPDRIVLRGMTKADLEAAPNFRADGR